MSSDRITNTVAPPPNTTRRGIEWPTGKPFIAQLLLEEDSGFDVMKEALTRRPRWKLVLRSLYWRARRQSAVWQLVELLVSRGFLNYRCLTVPIDPFSMSDSTQFVCDILGCYQHVTDDEREGLPPQSIPWYEDVGWLATMIVRQGVRLVEMFNTISQNSIIMQCEDEGKGNSMPDASLEPTNHTFGWWLPDGLSADETTLARQIQSCKDRFNAIDKMFMEVENISPDVLGLGPNQEALSGRLSDLDLGVVNGPHTNH
ncbi:hypothetical protein BO71DRAFT_428847 [Aspergillus ellipticus CBS 707.79]|uniref:Uncharacterized protein n=1 Tax=Aspergillus ellipticus CBS 707.79 TaxID=1448320 RepID=A0A319DDZ4_9EURO|nr:hypothetical protein BO71DRAFT_428847 [Aspergillus ellipticus CBS 707.79]